MLIDYCEDDEMDVSRTEFNLIEQLHVSLES